MQNCLKWHTVVCLHEKYHHIGVICSKSQECSKQCCVLGNLFSWYLKFSNWFHFKYFSYICYNIAFCIKLYSSLKGYISAFSLGVKIESLQ